MAIEIGSKGLAEVNLTIPQGASLAFTINDTFDIEVYKLTLPSGKALFA